MISTLELLRIIIFLSECKVDKYLSNDKKIIDIEYYNLISGNYILLIRLENFIIRDYVVWVDDFFVPNIGCSIKNGKYNFRMYINNEFYSIAENIPIKKSLLKEFTEYKKYLFKKFI